MPVTPIEPSAGSTPHFNTEKELPARLRLMRWLGHQEWAPRGTDRVLRALNHPDSAQHFLFDVDFFGKRYRGDLAHYIDWLVFSYGAAPHCELSLLQKATAYLREKRSGPITFFDVGANVGHHTLFMSGVADQVLSFEPFPAVREELEARLTLNRVNNVRVFPMGLGDEDQDLPYFASTGVNSGIGSFVEHGSSEYEAGGTLPVRRGDPLFQSLGLPRVDLLKIDVEGFEPNVLRGLRSTILRDRPIILTELMDSTRKNFGSEQGLRDCFFEGAILYGVTGRFHVRSYRLVPFHFATTEEILVLPPEYADLAAQPSR